MSNGKGTNLDSSQELSAYHAKGRALNSAGGPTAKGTERVYLLLERAEAAIFEKKESEARRLLKAALRHDPMSDQALIWLVYLAEDGEESLTYLARLLDAHPQHPEAREAIHWARRRVPTSTSVGVPTAAHKAEKAARKPYRLALGLGLLMLLISLVLLWQLGQSPAVPVQANAFQSAFVSLDASPTARPLLQIVKVLIPLFTPTPSPSPVPTPTPSSAWVPVAGQPQTYNLSCESRSAADLAGFWGAEIEELDFLSSIGFSDNPHVGFVGDVTRSPGSLPPYGYGVYAEPVAASLQSYGLDAQPVYNLGLDGLKAELLEGRPVLVWATYSMDLYEPLEWRSRDGRVSTVVPFMHTFVVTGFDEEYIVVLDAYDATVQRYPHPVFLKAWELFDQMAVTVLGPLQQ